MYFFPYTTFILETKLNQKEIVEKLQSVTERKKTVTITRGKKFFEGSIERDYFKINKNVEKSDYHPIVLGHIKHAISHKKIHCTIRYSIFLSIMYILSLPLTIYIFYSQPFLGAGLFIFIYAMVILGFNTQVSELKKKLQELFSED